MEVSEENLALIHALQIAPRVSWTDAAEILGSHPTTLATRWDRLRQSGLAWVTANPISPGMELSLSFFDIECTLDRRSAVIDSVCAMPEVVSVVESARNRDLMLIVQTSSLAVLGQTVVPRLAGIAGVTKYQASMCTRLHAEGHRWRLNVLDKRQQADLEALRPRTSQSAASWPAEYWDVVRILMRDGRASAADIAKEIGVHPTTASRRLNNILASDLVSFRCEMAQHYSGYPVSCQWFANVPAGQHENAAEALLTFRNLRLCASTTGTTNFTFVMWLRSVADVMASELAIAERVPAIALVESTIALNYPKRVGWLLDTEGRATGEVVVPRLPV
ncbi:Lrp/AsnC family transcriptional regulator [Pengzhenrongella sp.]|jgi:DNA-binding Lrp family transcriptional regulator|uniref:Lrp/AsnC family transcriptional regulator n=1 Tax=Pengzhenrongella sp. TaxID=2888820 RepID=UPI002F93F3EB